MTKTIITIAVALLALGVGTTAVVIGGECAKHPNASSNMASCISNGLFHSGLFAENLKPE